ncbi:Hypothetical protein POVN_LOCUS102 [uncultured virus]|nr:Hypothetical protein POVN_LOCUS102 [uncultured virus]
MTAPLWDDQKGLRLRATTSPDYVFLDIYGGDVSAAVSNFLKLPESEAIWHSEAKGWLLPVDALQPKLNPFLNIFRSYDIRDTKDAVQAQRERELPVGSKAQIHYIRYSEMRLLVMLLPAPKEVHDFYYKHEQYHDPSAGEAGLGAFGILSETDDGPLVDAYLKMVWQYLHNRGDTVRRGDVLRHNFNEYRNNATWIAETNRFVSLGFDVHIDEYGYVPPQFKVPSQFPICYWVDAIQHNRLVWFDYERFANDMEYVREPPVLTEAETEDVDEPPGENAMAFRFTFEKKVYWIYIEHSDERDSRPTYEEALTAFEGENVNVTAVNDTVMQIMLLPPKDEAAAKVPTVGVVGFAPDLLFNPMSFPSGHHAHAYAHAIPPAPAGAPRISLTMRGFSPQALAGGLLPLDDDDVPELVDNAAFSR